MRRLIALAVTGLVGLAGAAPSAAVAAAGPSHSVRTVVPSDPPVTLDLTITADARRIDVVGEATVEGGGGPFVVVQVDHGPTFQLAVGAAWWNGDGTTSWEVFANLGALPGAHTLTVSAPFVTDPPQEPLEVVVQVPDAEPGVLTLTRPQAANTYAPSGRGVAFTAIVPALDEAGTCPQTVLEVQRADSYTWETAPLAWKAGYAGGSCDLDLMALMPPVDADFRIRATADGYEDVSDTWAVWEGFDYAGPSRPWHRFSLSPRLGRTGHGTVLGIHPDGKLDVVSLAKSPSTPGALATVRHGGGSGWGGMAVYGPGDWSGDGFNDVLATDVYGTLFMYRGNGTGQLGSRVQVGNGWGPFRIVPTGDLTGDRRPDLLAVDNGGRLWLYPGAGAGRFAARRQVGNGWGSFQLHAAGDMNRDGRVDILGVDAQGRLWFYAGRGNGTFAMRVQVGNGWQSMRLASGADLTGDGINDVLARDLDGNLWVYRGRAGGAFGSRSPVPYW